MKNAEKIAQSCGELCIISDFEVNCHITVEQPAPRLLTQTTRYSDGSKIDSLILLQSKHPPLPPHFKPRFFYCEFARVHCSASAARILGLFAYHPPHSLVQAQMIIYMSRGAQSSKRAIMPGARQLLEPIRAGLFRGYTFSEVLIIFTALHSCAMCSQNLFHCSYFLNRHMHYYACFQLMQSLYRSSWKVSTRIYRP